VTAARPLPLSYTDFSPSIIPRLPLSSSSPHHCSIFERIPHPYSSDAFETLLLKHNLLSAYPLLPRNLTLGFPLGYMPPLTETVILPNNPSTYPYMREIHDYLQKELLAGRMSGPFSREEVELILRGPFFSSPLIVDVQPQQPGTPDKIRICRHLSKGSKLHPSVNSHIRKEDFPTRFDLASKVAEIVSLSFISPFPPFSLFLVMHPFAFCVWGVFFLMLLRAGWDICIAHALSRTFVHVSLVQLAPSLWTGTSCVRLILHGLLSSLSALSHFYPSPTPCPHDHLRLICFILSTCRISTRRRHLVDISASSASLFILFYCRHGRLLRFCSIYSFFLLCPMPTFCLFTYF
jgi:hypothetical protein